MKLDNFRIIRIPFSEKPGAYRNLLIKQRSENEKDQHNIVFVTNLDSMVPLEELQSYFEIFGKISTFNIKHQYSNKDSYYPKQRKGRISEMCRIGFQDRLGVRNLFAQSLSLTKKDFGSKNDLYLTITGEKICPLLSETSCILETLKHWAIPSAEASSRMTNENIKRYHDYLIRLRRSNLAAGQPDKDGFILVPTGSPAKYNLNKGAKNGENLATAPTFTFQHRSKPGNTPVRAKKRSREGVPDNFYKFQLRDKNREALAGLRREVLTAENNFYLHNRGKETVSID